MKTRRISLLLAVLFAFTMLFLVACGGEDSDGSGTNTGNTKQDITGVVFEDTTVTYDGTEKTIAVSGLPQGASVTYSPANSFKDAGSYSVTATVRKPGFKNLSLSATLVIAPKEIDIEWADLGPFVSTGDIPEINYTASGVVEGDTAEIEISFGDCDFTEEGTFSLTATVKNPNYTLKAEDTSVEFTVGSNVHTVTFDTGIEDDEPDTDSVEHNDTVDKPRRNPTNRGYEFLGWYLGDDEWDFDTPITEDITLTAKWKAIDYKITYYLDGGTNSKNNPKTFSAETEDQLEMPTKSGYIFLGWFSDSTLETPAPALGSARKDISLYAKWAKNSYIELDTDNTLDSKNPDIVLSEPAANGNFKYVFTANLASFGDNSAICIGRGDNASAKSYIKITKNQILAYEHDASGATNYVTKLLSCDMSGYIVVEITVNNEKATIKLQTANGTDTFDNLPWSVKCGKVFASVEDASLANVSLGWYTDAYGMPTWIVGDSNVGFNDPTSFTYHLTKNHYTDFLGIGAPAIDSAEALELFKEALKRGTPKYAIWSFGTDTAQTLANLESFIDLCKSKSITPILTTQPEGFDSDNAAINAAVLDSGERYIDFASMASCEGAVNQGKFTQLGAQLIYTRLLVDFPEITTGVSGLRYDSASIITGDIEDPEDRLSLSGNTIKDGKYLIFNAKLTSLEADDLIIVGHGYMEYNGAWVEIGPNSFDLYNYYSYTDPKKQTIVNDQAHGLEIKNFVTVILTCNADKGGSTLTIATDGGFYTCELRKGQGGDAGAMVALSSGVALRDCTLAWTCEDYEKDVWIFGDSYLGTTNPARWPYYMYNEGYQNALMIGYAGMNTGTALKDLKDAIQYDTPKYIVWCMGMNDGDNNGTISNNYYSPTMQMLEICEQHGIIPVIATIPTCIKVDNSVKNSYIKDGREGFQNYDYLIIDFAKAVDGYVSQSEATWYDGMLSTDNIHPALLGAKALYMQFLADFPEIMGGWDVTVYREKATFFDSTSPLTITSPSEIENNKVYTFSAEFIGEFTGTLEIGNDKATEGAMWIEIDSTTVTVYQNVNGVATEIKSLDHNTTLIDLVNVKIHVVGHTANISIMSAGEKVTTNEIFNFDTAWIFAGDVCAKADKIYMSNATLTFFTAE